MADAGLKRARQAAEQFISVGTLSSLDHVRTGNINETYCSTWQLPSGTPSQGGAPVVRFIHQRINQHVFPAVRALIENVRLVTEHLRSRLVQEGGKEVTLELIPTTSGAWCWQDSEGDFWRTFVFIDESESFDVCPSPAHAEAVGAAFGRFLRLLSNFEVSRLTEPIAKFQDVAARYEDFEEAVQRNSAARISEAEDLVAFVRTQYDLSQLFKRAMADGSVPKRVTHADPKVNNVMFLRGTTTVRCVVDLDTCMPGSSLYDFGDLVRSAGVPCAEDETDLSRVAIDPELYQALVSGYVGEAYTILTPRELELMPLAPGVIALSLGMRFLSDFLNGDTYFRVRFPQHNLVRARTQLAILKAVLASQKNLKEATVCVVERRMRNPSAICHAGHHGKSVMDSCS